MKKPLFTLILSIFCLASYAQGAFTEATFTAMMNRLQTDPAFFKNETDPSFTITFGNGGTATQEGMVKFAEDNVGLYKRKHANLKVSQVGSTGIATGTVVETFLSKDNPKIVNAIYTEQFTYTFSQVKGKWLWVAGQHTDFISPASEEEAAIKKILEAETLAGWANDTEKEFSYWHQTPYASFIGAADNKAYYILGIDGIKKFAVEAHKSNRLNPSPTPTLQNSKYFFRINGNTAFVTYQQEQNKEGKIGFTRENRYLEKVNGNWKVVNATFIVDASNSTSEYSVFSATTMKEILDEYKTDSKAFFNNRLSEDFRYTNQKGNYQPQKDFLDGTAQNIVSTELLQPVIFQSGDLAVVSGIHQTVRPDKDGHQTISQEAATYTFQRRNGKWMFVASQQNVVAK